jgi:hypothetical protein
MARLITVGAPSTFVKQLYFAPLLYILSRRRFEIAAHKSQSAPALRAWSFLQHVGALNSGFFLNALRHLKHTNGRE